MTRLNELSRPLWKRNDPVLIELDASFAVPPTCRPTCWNFGESDEGLITRMRKRKDEFAAFAMRRVAGTALESKWEGQIRRDGSIIRFVSVSRKKARTSLV